MITPQIERAISHLTNRGLPLHTATGVVASLAGESGRKLNTSAVGDSGKAYGIGQWHPDRQANFAQAMGRPIRGSSLEQQLDFLLWELNNTETRAKNALMQARDPMQAAAAFTAKYERPRDIPGESAKRAQLAAQLSGYTPRPMGQQYASNGYAGTMTDVPPRDMPSLADFAASRKQPGTQGGDTPPSLADFAASRKPAPAGDAFNMNPVTKRQTLTPTDAPKVDAATALGAGVVRGLADLPAGLNELNEKVAAFNPLTLATDRMTGGIAGKIRKAGADAIREWDKGYEADYQQKYGDSGAAQLGRVGGNVATAFIPGTGQVKAMQGIGNLVKAGKTAQAMGAGAGLGAMQSAVLSGGDPADTVAGATLGGLLPGIAKMFPMMPDAQAGRLLSQGTTDVPARGLMDKGIPRAAVAAATHGMSEGKRLVDDLVRARVQGNLNLAKDDPQKMLELLAAYNKVASRRGGAVRAGLPLVPAVQGVRQ